ncbi:hypothetical protein DYB32_003086 [Aphanomyces invadans]|uniref:Uncharacterized protein n=1 Tax=Aphanomyces invadans TaxID=157072 RepID=A0A418B1P3_9STRA|nr:hypothetical protein DYB32_003086 [Aphanomyces invadans]
MGSRNSSDERGGNRQDYLCAQPCIRRSGTPTENPAQCHVGVQGRIDCDPRKGAHGPRG